MPTTPTPPSGSDQHSAPGAAEVVAVIPAGASLPAAQAALNGMGQCYPPHELSLRTDPGTGAMVIVRAAPGGTAAPDGTQPDRATGAESFQTAPGNAAMALGMDEIGDLLTYAFTGDQDGVTVIAAWMARLLDSTEGAANFVTFTMNHANSQRYALTVQRVDGLTPAEKIAALQQQVDDLMA